MACVIASSNNKPDIEMRSWMAEERSEQNTGYLVDGWIGHS